MREQSYIKNNSHQNNIRGGETKVMKKVLNTLLVLALIFTMVSPAFAAANTTQEKFNELKAAGILAGDANGNMLALDKTMTRQELAKIASTLSGVAPTPGVEIAAFAKDYKTGVWGFDQGWIQAAYTAGLMKGKGAAGFDSQGVVTVGELITVIIRTMGLADQVDASKNWPAGEMAVAVANKLIPAAGVSASDVATYASLVTQSYNSYVHNNPAPAALAVVSAQAINGKQVKVVFNKAVDETKAENVANYSFFKQGALTTDILNATANGASAELQADGKTVILTVDTASSIANYTTLNKLVVESEVGLAADATLTNVALSDTAIPQLLSATATGSDEITLTFSEPVTSAGAPINVVLNDGTIGVNLTAAYSVTKYSLKISTYSNLVAGTEYTVKIKAGTNIVDYAAYGVAPSTASFTYAPVTAAPTYAVKSSTETEVTIEFSHALKAGTLVGNTAVQASHTYKGQNLVTGTAITNPSGDNKTFVITFANALPPGNATVFMNYVLNTLDTNKAKDNYGNIVNLVNVSVTTVADTTPPTANVELLANSNTQINITFSETVTGSLTAANYVLKKGTNAVPNGGPVVTGVLNQVKIIANSPMSGDYTLTIKDGIRDTSTATNKFVETTFNISVPDLIAPSITREDNATVDTKYYTQDGATAKKVRIYFNEAMNQTLLADVNMYQEATTLQKPTTATPAADGKSVYLVFGNTLANALNVGTLTDVAGNKLVGFSATLTAVGGSTVGLLPTGATTVPNNVEVISTSSVKVFLNDLVQGLVTGDVEINNGSGWVNPSSFSVDNSSGKSVVTFNLPAGTVMDMAATGVQVRTVSAANNPGATVNATNPYGIAFNVGATAGVDVMAPVVDKVVYVSATEIQVNFKEALLPGTIGVAGTNGFSVSGGTLTTAVKGTANNVIILTGTNFTENTDVLYNGSAGITDANNNALASINHSALLTAAAISIAKDAANERFVVTANYEYTLNYTNIKAAIDAHADLSGTVATLTGNNITFVTNNGGAGALNGVVVSATDITETKTGAVITIATFNISVATNSGVADVVTLD